VQLEASLDEFTENGLGVVTISYDSVDILKSFADRMGGFRYPTLADPDSEIIEAFGIRNPNPEPGSRTDGMTFPGIYIVDTDGIVQEKFFEDSHRIRPTADTILMKTFGADGGRRTEVQLPQFNFAAYASQDEWRPGNTVLMGELVLPEPEILYLEPIDESVPVYHGTARIQRDITLAPAYRDETIAVDAILTYQTCDDEICFPPADFEFTMHFDVLQNDGQRAPEGIRHPGE
jgi:hypothetical protein